MNKNKYLLWTEQHTEYYPKIFTWRHCSHVIHLIRPFQHTWPPVSTLNHQMMHQSATWLICLFEYTVLVVVFGLTVLGLYCWVALLWRCSCDVSYCTSRSFSWSFLFHFSFMFLFDGLVQTISNKLQSTRHWIYRTPSSSEPVILFRLAGIWRLYPSMQWGGKQSKTTNIHSYRQFSVTEQTCHSRPFNASLINSQEMWVWWVSMIPETYKKVKMWDVPASKNSMLTFSKWPNGQDLCHLWDDTHTFIRAG